MEKKIGQGQFSVVHRARNVVDGQILALKKIQVAACLCLQVALLLPALALSVCVVVCVCVPT